MHTQVVNSDVFVIEELYYIPMGEHVPVYNRPYVVNSDQNAISVIHDRMMENNSGKVTGAMIGNVMGQLIQPSAVAEAGIINNDWVTQPRFVFLMKVRAIDAVGSEIISYFQGYTNYDGINRPTGTADTNMVHYINSVIETYYMVLNTPMGVVRKEKLYKVYNVFAAFNSEFYTQRPMDVIENIELAAATNFLDHGMGDISSVNLGNMINGFNSKIITSTIDNNIGTDYLCRVINGGVQKQKSKSILLGSFESNINEDSVTSFITTEPSLNDNRFMKYVSKLGGFMIVQDSFTMSQLLNIDTTIHDRFKLLLPTKNYVDPVLAQTPTVGDFWHGQDPVTLKAYSLIESSIALAMKYGFNKLFFSVSNMTTPTGQAEIFITNFTSFLGLDDSDFAFLLERVKATFISDIFLGETQGGIIPLHADVYVDLLGTSKIYLSYGGYHGNWYTLPTTANSLFSPVLTASPGTLEAVTNQFDNMIQSIASPEMRYNSFM